MCGRTFVHKGVLVLVIRVSEGSIPDDVFEACMAGMKRFASTQRRTPFNYHLVLDLHRTISIPMENMITLNQHLVKKEHILRPNLVSATYIVQGRMMAKIMESMFSMFGTWVTSQTLECYPNGSTDDSGHGIPECVLPKVLDFMQSEALQKGL